MFCQAISFFAIYLRPKARKIPKYFEIIFLSQFPLFLFYSNIPTSLAIALYAAFLIISIIYLNVRIIELLSGPEGIIRQYKSELLGSAFGIVVWALLFDRLGPQFSFAIIAALSFGIISKDKYLRLFCLVILSICLMPFENKKPLINKNQAFKNYNGATIQKRIWDINATVDLISNTDEKEKIFLFNGGEIKSQIPLLVGINWSNEKNKILNGKIDYISGYELVIPYIKLKNEIKSAYLISCIGGQELYLAKAFGVQRKIVSDINLSALQLSLNDLKNVNGDIFADAQIVHQDGRKYLENNRFKLDLVQIYNAHAASHYGLLGKGTQPTTLMTLESLKTYYESLSENGILHIGTFDNNNLYPLLEKFINERSELSDENILILNRTNNRTDIKHISVFLSKQKWDSRDLINIKSLFTQDSENKYSIKFFSKKPSSETIQYSEVTDDRPFYHFELSKNIKKLYLYFFEVVLVLLVGFFIFSQFFLSTSQNRLKYEFGFNIILGVSFALNQLFIIYSAQSLLGLPGQGLALGLILGLGASLFSLSLPKGFFWRIVVPLAFIICSAGLIFNSSIEFWKIAAGLFCQIIINRTYTLRLLNGNVALNLVYALNGIGFCLGTALFYLLWLHLGLSFAYILFFFTITFLVIDKRFRLDSHSDN